jgi:eukaryotic-like serine/threonine-protein kinase
VLVSVAGVREHRVLVERAAPEDKPALSPDSTLLAYNSSESGRHEIFAISLDGTNRRWQVSVAGGVQPRWRGDGRELFFLGLDGAIMSALLEPMEPLSSSRLTWSRPRRLFTTRISPSHVLDQFAAARDGLTFVLAVPVLGPAHPLVVVLR